MNAQADQQNLRHAIAGKFCRLIQENPVETSSVLAFIFWINALSHQTRLLESPLLPTVPTTNAVTIGLTTSLLTAMALATCLHFLICMSYPARYNEALVAAGNRARFNLAAWTLIVYLGLSVGMPTSTDTTTSATILFIAAAALITGAAAYAWSTTLRMSKDRAEITAAA